MTRPQNFGIVILEKNKRSSIAAQTAEADANKRLLPVLGEAVNYDKKENKTTAQKNKGEQSEENQEQGDYPSDLYTFSFGGVGVTGI